MPEWNVGANLVIKAGSGLAERIDDVIPSQPIHSTADAVSGHRRHASSSSAQGSPFAWGVVGGALIAASAVIAAAGYFTALGLRQSDLQVGDWAGWGRVTWVSTALPTRALSTVPETDPWQATHRRLGRAARGVLATIDAPAPVRRLDAGGRVLALEPNADELLKIHRSLREVFLIAAREPAQLWKIARDSERTRRSSYVALGLSALKPVAPKKSSPVVVDSKPGYSFAATQDQVTHRAAAATTAVTTAEPVPAPDLFTRAAQAWAKLSRDEEESRRKATVQYQAPRVSNPPPVVVVANESYPRLGPKVAVLTAPGPVSIQPRAIQPILPALPVRTPPAPTTQTNPGKSGSEGMEPSSVSVTSTQTPDSHGCELSKRRWAEAFSWERTIALCANRVVDLASDDQSVWSRAEEPGYLPTLTREIAGARESEGALLSRNLLAQLKLLGLGEQAGDRGVIFGRSPAGWQVAVEGALSVIYFRESGAPSTNFGDGKGITGFLATSVPAGSAGVQLRSVSGGTTAALRLPSLAGQATYVDARELRQLRVLGSVALADGRWLIPARGAEVRLSALPASRTLAGVDGRFSIDGFARIEGWPVILDVRPEGGFWHRYELSLADEVSATLHVFSKARLAGWVAQLQGGVHRRSGLVLGALRSEWFRGAPRASAEWRAEARSLHLPDSAAAFESYVIEAAASEDDAEGEAEDAPLRDRLSLETALTARNPRFAVTDVAPGAGLLRLQAKRPGVAAWTHLFHGAPGVVNVILR